MPTIDIDKFDETPKVGDKIKVEGRVQSIDEDDGTVEVTYGDVSIMQKRKKRRNRRDDDDDDFTDEVVLQETMMPPESQTLDQALAQSFPNTQ